MKTLIRIITKPASVRANSTSEEVRAFIQDYNRVAHKITAQAGEGSFARALSTSEASAIVDLLKSKGLPVSGDSALKLSDSEISSIVGAKRLNGKTTSGAKEYTCQFWQPGVVSYEDCGEGVALLNKETMDKMLPSFVGKPVVIDHVEAQPEEIFNSGQAVGRVTEAVWNAETGWYDAKFTVEDPKAQELIESGYSVSCAFNVMDAGEGGEWHSIKYNEEVTDGSFTHLALVENPRYEDSKIFKNSKKMLLNSKGIRMNKRFKVWEKDSGEMIGEFDEAQVKSKGFKLDHYKIEEVKENSSTDTDIEAIRLNGWKPSTPEQLSRAVAKVPELLKTMGFDALGEEAKDPTKAIRALEEVLKSQNVSRPEHKMIAKAAIDALRREGMNSKTNGIGGFDNPPKIGDVVTFSAGRFQDTKGKVIAMGTQGNNYTVQMDDGTKAIIFPSQITYPNSKENAAPKVADHKGVSIFEEADGFFSAPSRSLYGYTSIEKIQKALDEGKSWAEGSSTSVRKQNSGDGRTTSDGKTLDDVSMMITGKKYRQLPDDGPAQEQVMAEFEKMGGVAQKAFNSSESNDKKNNGILRVSKKNCSDTNAGKSKMFGWFKSKKNAVEDEAKKAAQDEAALKAQEAAKDMKENGEQVNLAEQMVEIDGEQVSLADLITTYKAEQAEQAVMAENAAVEEKVLSPEDPIADEEGTVYKVGDLLNAYQNKKARMNAEAEEKKNSEGGAMMKQALAAYKKQLAEYKKAGDAEGVKYTEASIKDLESKMGEFENSSEETPEEKAAREAKENETPEEKELRIKKENEKAEADKAEKEKADAEAKAKENSKGAKKDIKFFKKLNSLKDSATEIRENGIDTLKDKIARGKMKYGSKKK